jgi:hypothetical protein
MTQTTSFCAVTVCTPSFQKPASTSEKSGGCSALGTGFTCVRPSSGCGTFTQPTPSAIVCAHSW